SKDGNYLVSCFGSDHGPNLILKITPDLNVIWSTLVNIQFYSSYNMINFVEEITDSNLIAYFKPQKDGFGAQSILVIANVFVEDSSNLKQDIELCGIKPTQTTLITNDKLIVLGREGIIKVDTSG